MEDFFAELWEAAKQAGPFGTALMLFVWWRTDIERQRLMAEGDGRLERMIGAMNSATEALRENTKAILFMDRKR